ncbi:BIG/ATPase V1 complex, subunit S1 [Corynascus novoguineensis]|uniref:Protein BIG1 n=1 Tax=Corynascus novoguineensis TaxID=1126955 RepID=A0AAN7D080_9PEZI|nr:BIG/ATPase V1 complex, subunit S1 [Corynascus novoguineensis]
MKLTTTTAFLAYAASKAQAFSDSSPFILFSTAKLSTPSSTPQLQTASQVFTTAKSLLSSCPTSRYVLISQPNLHAADIRDGSGIDSNSCRMPSLCRAAESGNKKSSWDVAEVIGQLSGKALEEYINGACEGRNEEVSVQRFELRHLPAASAKAGEDKERQEILGDNDYELGKLLEQLGDDYTVLVYSDPNEFNAYEPEFSQPVHMDLRRWAEEALEVVSRKREDSTNNLPLFEKYQFFTPGIFMSFIVLGVLLSILGVGLKALASLEVSYGAFDKEMGPAAQKKQM